MVIGGRRRLPKLPRAAYRVAGAAIACTGALAAREIGEQLPEDYRRFVWLAGGAVVFLGVAILSLGSRAHLQAEEDRGGR